jgi:hypothetical protein
LSGKWETHHVGVNCRVSWHPFNHPVHPSIFGSWDEHSQFSVVHRCWTSTGAGGNDRSICRGITKTLQQQGMNIYRLYNSGAKINSSSSLIRSFQILCYKRQLPRPKQRQAAYLTWLIMILSYPPGVLENSSSALACTSRFCIDASLSVARPRRTRLYAGPRQNGLYRHSYINCRWFTTAPLIILHQ